MGTAGQAFDFAKPLAKASGHPTALVRTDGSVVFCNDLFTAFVRDHGRGPSGDWISLLPEEVAKQVGAHLARPGADPKQSPLRVDMGVSGHCLHIEGVTGLDGDIASLVQIVATTASDTTELSFLLEALEQGVWTYEVATRRFAVSTAWLRLRGQDAQLPGAVGHRGWLQGVNLEDQSTVSDLFMRQLAGELDGLSCQYRHHRDDGTTRWLLCRSKIMQRSPSGDVLVIVGLDTDVTHVRDKEIAQIEDASKLQLAVGVAGIGLWEFDSATAQVNWDDRMLQIYGLTDGLNVRSDNLWERYLHPDDRECAVAKADQALSENRDFRHDYRIVLASGEVRHVRSAARFIAVAGTKGKLVGVNIDVTEDYRRAEELEAARQLLEHDSRHDALTGLANRRLLDETTQDVLTRLQPDDAFAVLQIDLDLFKKVNDTLGHAAGDAVLLRVADVLKALVPDDALVCRTGGDEFVVLLPSADKEAEVRALCQAILDQISEPMILQGQICHFGLSIGCAFGTGDLTDAAEVFINADVALYAAKSDGRSCFRIFAPGMRAVADFDASAHHDISAALMRGEILCHFQPQFDAQTYELNGAEALVRWQCPKRGLLKPDAFVDIARSTGLGAKLDEAVLDFVLGEQSRWAAAGCTVPTVALNISVERLCQEDLLRQLDAKLKPHHSISFELLETAFLDSLTDELAQRLAALRQRGIRLDLDDFGSGHASVVALQAIKPDRVKIDRMLVAPIETSPAQICILEALVQVAEIEGCRVVVEGIETLLQLETIKRLRCHTLQGYQLARPMTSKGLMEYLDAQALRVGPMRQQSAQARRL